nr:transposase family protein [Streptomyces sp. Root369]
MVFVLALAACAVLAGATPPRRSRNGPPDAPPGLLARLGGTVREPDSGAAAPDGATVRRVLQRIDGDALDAAIGAWLADRAHTADLNRANADAPSPWSSPGRGTGGGSKPVRGAAERGSAARQARESGGRRTATRPGA